MLSLNVGCGTDYREGFVNIDGSDVLPRVDQVIDFNSAKLSDHFGEIDHILCNDFIEHFFHWEAVSLLEDFYRVLRGGGTLELRVPDSEWIINSDKPTEWKLRQMYGGQDIYQGKMDFSREEYPQFFCHKYGWTRERIRKDLENIGFRNLRFEQVNANFVTHGRKP